VQIRMVVTGPAQDFLSNGPEKSFSEILRPISITTVFATRRRLVIFYICGVLIL